MRLAMALLTFSGLASAQPGAPNKPRVRREPPTVSIASLVVTGPLEKDIVRRYLRRNNNKFTYCYEKHLLVDDKLKGTLKAAYEITADGTVANAGTMGVEGEAAACTKKVLERIEYPRPKGDKSVAVKVDFVLRR